MPHKVTWSQLWELGHGHLWGHYSADHILALPGILGSPEALRNLGKARLVDTGDSDSLPLCPQQPHALA